MLVFDIDGSRKWATHTFEQGDGAMEVELYCPTSDEWMKFIGRFNLGGGKSAKWTNARGWIAKHWFRSFEGARTPDGKEIENTEPHRAAMLQSTSFFDYVVEKLKEGQEAVAEGNADSDSD